MHGVSHETFFQEVEKYFNDAGIKTKMDQRKGRVGCYYRRFVTKNLMIPLSNGQNI